ncbi:hypothetical protein BC834DRAFT_887564 [Gloeopeniophorella convolvens]|nr:hypothetical protein BC834DRAFT_887564 [Gloeopeniophorella convolvens]
MKVYSDRSFMACMPPTADASSKRNTGLHKVLAPRRYPPPPLQPIFNDPVKWCEWQHTSRRVCEVNRHQHMCAISWQSTLVAVRKTGAEHTWMCYRVLTLSSLYGCIPDRSQPGVIQVTAAIMRGSRCARMWDLDSIYHVFDCIHSIPECSAEST